MRVSVLAALGLLALAVLVPGTTASPAPNPIQAENALPGSDGWRVPPAHTIEGYASEVSVAPGETLHLHVSTAPAAGYRVEIYRLGWYGGAGGRLQTCLPDCTSDEQGRPQPVHPPDADGYLDAGWPVTDAVRVPVTWVSGYYLAVLRLGSGKGAWVPFIVRAPASRRSAIVVQAAVNTWQAYNRWGGTSLYKDATGASCKGVCTRVSFNRPYDPATQSFWQFELPLVHFLEQNGYDVSYVTDADVDREPGELLRHRLVIVAGHDEYWTKAMRDGFDRARALGTNLAFMGANTGYWQMRYADGRRTILEYRLRRLDPEPNPALKTVRFRELMPPRPECELEGVQYVRTDVESIGGQGDYAVVPASLSDPWFSGTGFTAASIVPGVVGYEWDAVTPGCRTPPLTVLLRFTGSPAPADAVRFTAPSGAVVFSAGSLSFAQGLDEYRWQAGLPPTGTPGLETFVRNALAELVRPAAPREAWAIAGRRGIVITVRRAPDPRVADVRVFRAPAGNPLARGSRGMHLVCRTLARRCLDRTAPLRRRVRYVVVVQDRWASSTPYVTSAVTFR